MLPVTSRSRLGWAPVASAGAAACGAGGGTGAFAVGLPLPFTGCRGVGLGALIGGFDLGRIVLGLLAGAALHIFLLETQRDGEVHIGRAVQRHGLLDLLARVPIHIELGRRRAIRLARLLILPEQAAVSRIVDRIEEAVAQPHADGAIPAVGIDAAIDRRLLDVLLFLLAAAEEIEQAAAAALLRRWLAAAAATGERILQLGLPPPIAAAAGERLALLLELGELAARVLDAVVHVEAFRAAHQAAAEDEEALEAAGIFHGRAGALEHAVGLGDLLIDAGHVFAIAAAASRRGEVLLELHAADVAVAQTLRQGKTGAAGEPRAAQREQSKARARDRPYGRRNDPPKITVDAHDWFPSPRSHPTHYAPLDSGVNEA